MNPHPQDGLGETLGAGVKAGGPDSLGEGPSPALARGRGRVSPRWSYTPSPGLLVPFARGLCDD